MAKDHRGEDSRWVELTLDNAATAQISVVNRADDSNAPEAGFLIRVWEPWGSHPGEPNPDGEDYQDGTGHNLTCLSVVVRFTEEGAPVVDHVDVRQTHWRPKFAESERERRERANSAEEQRRRKLAEAESLATRAAKLREEAGSV